MDSVKQETIGRDVLTLFLFVSQSHIKEDVA